MNYLSEHPDCSFQVPLFCSHKRCVLNPSSAFTGLGAGAGSFTGLGAGACAFTGLGAGAGAFTGLGAGAVLIASLINAPIGFGFQKYITIPTISEKINAWTKATIFLDPFAGIFTKIPGQIMKKSNAINTNFNKYIIIYYSVKIYNMVTKTCKKF
jgi:hypothetical protein